MDNNSIIDHYCNAVGSRRFETKILQTITVVLYPEALQKGNAECFSLGMSRLEQFADKGTFLNRDIRTELYCSVHANYLLQALELMEGLANYPRWTRTQLHWGHSVLLANTISGCTVRAILLTMPPFKAEMMSIDRDGERIDLLYVVPLFGNEFDLLRRIGVDSFEEKLEKAAIDVTDLNRPPLC